MKTLRSSFWPLALSSVGAALLFVFVYKRVKSKPNTVKDKDDEAPPGGHSTDLHGRPWRNMKKSEKAEWHAKHGETDKDTARIEATSKEIIFPKVDGVEMPITEKSLPHWITVRNIHGLIDRLRSFILIHSFIVSVISIFFMA